MPQDFTIKELTVSLPCREGLVQIRSNGKAEIRRNNKVDQFQLPIYEGAFFVEKLYFSDCLGDFLIAYDISNSIAEGISMVVRIDRESLGIMWRTVIRSCYVSEPLLQGHFLYVAAIGWAGKIDIRTGLYIWEIRGLYASGTTSDKRGWSCYNSFLRPELKGTTVIFPEDPEHLDAHRPFPPQKLVVDDKSGKVISGIVPSDKKRD